MFTYYFPINSQQKVFSVHTTKSTEIKNMIMSFTLFAVFPSFLASLLLLLFFIDRESSNQFQNVRSVNTFLSTEDFFFLITTVHFLKLTLFIYLTCEILLWLLTSLVLGPSRISFILFKFMIWANIGSKGFSSGNFKLSKNSTEIF